MVVGHDPLLHVLRATLGILVAPRHHFAARMALGQYHTILVTFWPSPFTIHFVGAFSERSSPTTRTAAVELLVIVGEIKRARKPIERLGDRRQLPLSERRRRCKVDRQA